MSASTTRRPRALRAGNGGAGATAAAAETGFLGLVAPSYLLCFALAGGLVAAAGLWEVLANTRLLAALLAGGVVALGEDDPGLGTGVPGVHYFIRSQEFVTWSLVLLAAALFMAVAILKGFQFHRIARFVGIEGTFGQHLRAYIYGHGIGRMTPYRMGEVAWVSALQSQGATIGQAARLVFIFKGFLLFEIFIFAILGLVMSGLLAWGMALVPPFAILLAAWLLMRPAAAHSPGKKPWLERAAEVFGALTSEFQTLIVLTLLSLISFALVEFGTYIIPQAFTTRVTPLVQDVLLYVVVTPSVIVMAVVAGYIARLVQVTPGGIGQFELAFALVLMVNRLPMPEAITLALLVSAVRYATGIFLFGGTMLLFGVETNFNRVRALFGRDPATGAEAAP
ncbi:lysylphosphatidylglycerol synthase domain-containing protein [Leisingera sp. D0M16]|uniref:lysylphosphatidylglycerol synthase domain-containing protein n=1 Tax=Leisingera coralii TaxID=3351347 RepID=UPI003B819122